MDSLQGLTWVFAQAAPITLIASRLGGFFITAPVFNSTVIPTQVKALLVFGLSIMLVPSVNAAIPENLTAPLWGILIAKELLVGLFLGFCMSLVFYAIQMGMDMVGRAAGFAAMEMFNPDIGDTTNPLGDVFYMAALLIFMHLGGHLHMLALIAQSWNVVPAGGFFPGPWLGQALATGVEQTAISAVTIAFPIEAAIVLITISEGVITRAVPQINVLQVTFAVKTLAAMALLSVALPAAIAFFALIIQGGEAFTVQVLKAMG